MGTGHMDQRTTAGLMDFQNVDPDQIALMMLLAGDLLGSTQDSIGGFVALADADEHIAGGGINAQDGAYQQLLSLGGIAFIHNITHKNKLKMD